MDVEVMNGFDQGIKLQIPPHAPRRMKVVADPFAQIARLADIDDRAETVLHQVHTRLVREFPELFPDRFCCRHKITMSEEAPVLKPSDVESHLTGRNSDAPERGINSAAVPQTRLLRNKIPCSGGRCGGMTSCPGPSAYTNSLWQRSGAEGRKTAGLGPNSSFAYF